MIPFPEEPESQTIQALRIIYGGIQTLMASFDDLVTATNQLVQNDHAVAAEVQTLTTSINRLVADFDAIKTTGVLTADQQAKLDASVESVTSAAADLAKQTASMSTEQGSVDTADPAPQARHPR